MENFDEVIDQVGNNIEDIMDFVKQHLKSPPKEMLELTESSLFKKIGIDTDDILQAEFTRTAAITVSYLTTSIEWAMAKEKMYDLKVPESAIEIMMKLYEELPDSLKEKTRYAKFESAVLGGLIALGCKSMVNRPKKDDKDKTS